ncbi:hypothetical protein [Nannocystis punicea]|uniref:Outer membrane protein beta-barrel domain-containing protein n=1 Tax=Nannocystis punicea TaxID=2995304 RepID=A0ABY7H462_9BACT|nr:hypothetical protein [Nannocystis poenicansa]WAS94061.1 hypothetical protein O0S08_48675 [Nannocystis poenicansa]
MLGWIFALAAAAGAVTPEAPPPPPRLVIAGGFMIGPHAPGEAACQTHDSVQRCEHTGNFFGAGANLELRARAVGPLYFHGRGAVIGNVRQRPYGVHKGLVDVGIGLGVYSRLAFIRIEYMFVPTFGPNTYLPPFYDKQAGRDVWGKSAGMISGGVRKYLTPRLAGELWGGLVIGPHSKRTTLQEDAGADRILVTFLASIGISFDLIPGRAPPPPKPAPKPAPAPAPALPTLPTPVLTPESAPVATPPAPASTPESAPPTTSPPPASPEAPPPAENAIGPWRPAPQ